MPKARRRPIRYGIAFFLGLFLTQARADSLPVRDFQVSGPQCYNWDQSPLVVTPFRVHLPFRNWIYRTQGAQSVTGHCEFSLWVDVPPNHRLTLYAISGQNIMLLGPQSSARSRFELTLGTPQSSLRAEVQQHALLAPLADLLILDTDGEIIGDCGKTTLLRGSTKTEIFGGSGQTNSTLGVLAFDYALTPCETEASERASSR